MSYKSKNYLNEIDFYFEIVISKAKGKLTPKAAELLILIGENIISKMGYYNEDDRNDCRQTGLYMLFSRWESFNENKYTKALPYYSEICKRGIAQGFNELVENKTQRVGDKPTFVSMDRANDGDGVVTF